MQSRSNIQENRFSKSISEGKMEAKIDNKIQKEQNGRQKCFTKYNWMYTIIIGSKQIVLEIKSKMYRKQHRMEADKTKH